MTQAEWDAERDRRAQAMTDTLPSGPYIPLAVVFKYKQLATATMPPRPVEPPSVTRGDWTITHDGKEFIAVHRVGQMRHLKDAADLAVSFGQTHNERLTLDLIALRNGPLPRYEVWGYSVTGRGEISATFFTARRRTLDQCLQLAEAEVTSYGGTVEPIYRQVTP